MIESKGPVKVKAVIKYRDKNLKGNKYLEFFNKEQVKNARRFHSTLGNYRPTPLVDLQHFARELGISRVFVKDESLRFGLNSFKALGGIFAMARYMCSRLGREIEEVTIEYLKSKEAREKIGHITFVTATDGNHGRGVAWAARQLGQRAVVYLPKGAAESRVKAIRETGAEAYVTEFNYDDTVRFAIEQAKKHGWQIIQDTAWEGYEEIPMWIMQGYTTMADEALEQLEEMGIPKPTHLFLQAGVGGMAAAVLGYYCNCYRGEHPITAIVEPNNAACVFASALARDGRPHAVKGDLNTIMAGLACGEPSPIAWEILRDFADAYISCPDYIAARGIRILANPLGSDKKVVSGESGAVGTGLLSVLMQYRGCSEIREALGLDQNSVILLFSTEGDTDPVNYRQILWDGKYPMPY